MASQVIVNMKNGQTVLGVSYRMDPHSVPVPSAPASPAPFHGGMYHIQTPYGWVDIPDGEVQSISISFGAHT